MYNPLCSENDPNVTLDFYSGNVEYLKRTEYFSICHIKFNNKNYAVVRGSNKLDGLENWVRKDETLILENDRQRFHCSPHYFLPSMFSLFTPLFFTVDVYFHRQRLFFTVKRQPCFSCHHFIFTRQTTMATVNSILHFLVIIECQS